ncbi:MAG: ABC transporter ATP-binding protein [Alphaproteobacteria bacterium]|jgi:iron complex transport system ATP-binding protein|nr:ABC transporter ATP-binding protein [Alphaproteobacteria bacterium]
MTLLSLEHMTVTRGARRVIDDVSLTIGAGEFVGLIGPNGAGKTTLMRAALSLLPAKGTCNLRQLKPSERARAVAWLPQQREIAWPVDVETVVALGRIPYLPRGASLRDDDRAAVGHAVSRMGLEAFAGRIATQLSGGEQARVLIARALAQDTPLFMADEPIAGLDPAHQLSTMRAFADLARDGRSVLAALHDLPLAARYCTRLILIDAGRIVADGPPRAVLTEENVAEVFGVRGAFAETGAGVAFQVLEALP